MPCPSNRQIVRARTPEADPHRFGDQFDAEPDGRIGDVILCQIWRTDPGAGDPTNLHAAQLPEGIHNVGSRLGQLGLRRD